MNLPWSEWLSQLLFVSSWLLIPLIVEVVPAFIGMLSLHLRRESPDEWTMPDSALPPVTLIIPIYNSEQNLESCLTSVYQSHYPSNRIEVLLANNQTADNSRQVFERCRTQFPQLSIQWMDTAQGKAKALNAALFNSHGAYILNIDSDGTLHPDAIRRMVAYLEYHPQLQCATGTVLIDPHLIRQTVKPSLRRLQTLECLEYAQTFLVGRYLESRRNQLFTISGAFSAFRREALLDSQLYHTGTLCEDTYITFEFREQYPDGVGFCKDAVFLTDPIDSLDHLYTQRKRWQKGELEIAHLFLQKRLHKPFGFFRDFCIRLLVQDHTFAFPRAVWWAVLAVLIVTQDYSAMLVALSLLTVYGCYTLLTFAYYGTACAMMKQISEYRQAYRRMAGWVFLFPLYKSMLFWMRLAGFFDGTSYGSAWKNRSLTQEWHIFCTIVRRDFAWVHALHQTVKRLFNQES